MIIALASQEAERECEMEIEPASMLSDVAPGLPGFAAMYSAKRRYASLTVAGTSPGPTVPVKRN
ncbi:hypothetical protein, partial [Rhodopseudomonas palustris]|uniref:hypothetical protein n=1 Tax=Rhodopseudomonas palustris TaxID=1076 RepID=UPI00128E8699